MMKVKTILAFAGMTNGNGMPGPEGWGILVQPAPAKGTDSRAIAKALSGLEQMLDDEPTATKRGCGKKRN